LGHSAKCRGRQYTISQVALWWFRLQVPGPLDRLLSEAREQTAARLKRSCCSLQPDLDKPDRTFRPNSRTDRPTSHRKQTCRTSLLQLPTYLSTTYGAETAKSQIAVEIWCPNWWPGTRLNRRSSTDSRPRIPESPGKLRFQSRREARRNQ